MTGWQLWSRRVFSFPVALGMALLTTWYFLATMSGDGNRIITDPDVWWHLKNADYLIRTGHIIRQELWSFTVQGKPWIDFEWLAELPYYVAFRAMAERGLFVVMALATSAILLGVYLLSYLRSRDWKVSFLATFAAVILATVSLAPRTLLFGWLCLIVELGILWSYREGRDVTWGLPLLMLLWINLHGSWFIGFVLLVVFVGCGFVPGRWGDVISVGWTPAQRRKLLVVTALSFALLFINPYGWRLVAYPLDVAFGQGLTLKFIAEWGSLDFHELRGKVVLGMLVVLAVANLVRRRQWQLADLLFVLIGVYGALTYSRFCYLAGILICPILSLDLKGLAGPYVRAMDRQMVNAVAFAVMLALVVAVTPSKARLRQQIVEAYPEQALPYLRGLDPSRRVFNTFEWGGWMLWNLPALPVFIDGRTDIFVHEGVMADYALSQEPGAALEVLGRRHIEYVMVPREAGLAAVLRAHPGWRVGYEDGRTVVFERRR